MIDTRRYTQTSITRDEKEKDTEDKCLKMDEISTKDEEPRAVQQKDKNANKDKRYLGGSEGKKGKDTEDKCLKMDEILAEDEEPSTILQKCKTANVVKEKEKEAESEDEDERSEERGEKREAEEGNEQRNRQKAKCLWHEKAKCSREDCKFRHPRKVCKNCYQENCKLGENYIDNHPRINCPYWIHSNCNRGYNCPLRHSEQRRENSP